MQFNSFFGIKTLKELIVKKYNQDLTDIRNWWNDHDSGKRGWTTMVIGNNVSNPMMGNFLATEAPNEWVAYTLGPGLPVADYKGWSDYVTVSAPTNSTYQAFNARPSTSGSSNYTGLWGFNSGPGHYGTGTLSVLKGIETTTVVGVGAGLVSNSYGMYVANPVNGATITNCYGIYIEDETKGSTLNYGIYKAGTTAPNVLSGPTAIGGTKTNDSAAAGFVGELVTSAASATNFPASATAGDLVSISLTAGDWNVHIIAIIENNNSTFTSAFVGCSTHAGNDLTGLTDGTTNITTQGILTGTNFINSSFGPVTFQLASTTTVYLKYQSSYTGGPPKLAGSLVARRVR